MPRIAIVHEEDGKNMKIKAWTRGSKLISGVLAEDMGLYDVGRTSMMKQRYYIYKCEIIRLYLNEIKYFVNDMFWSVNGGFCRYV